MTMLHDLPLLSVEEAWGGSDGYTVVTRAQATLDHAKAVAHQGWDSVASHTVTWAHDISNASANAWPQTEEWFRQTWTSAATSAHDLWGKVTTSLHERFPHQQDQVQVWWNKSVDTEHEWYNHTIVQLHQFGNHLKGLWGTTAGKVEDKERVLEENFEEWWQSASEEEKSWWNDTMVAFHRFQLNAQDRERLWWSMTEQAASDTWNTTKRKSQKVWGQVEQDAEQVWERTEHKAEDLWDTAVEETETEAEKAWDATREGTQHAWDVSEHAVVNTAEKAWDSTRDASKHAWETSEHVAQEKWNETVAMEREWWNATQLWFHKRAAAEDRRPLLYLNSTRAYQLIMNYYGWFDQSSDFFMYQQGWDAQINQGYCAVASSAALLNSLRPHVELPIDPLYDPYPYATQPDLLDNQCVHDNVVRHNETFDGVFKFPGGLNLAQTARLLECHLPSWNVSLVHVTATFSLEQMRNDLLDALRNPQARVIINFDRQSLHQHGGGHFSPVASYSSSQDAFLVLDVAKYKYPSVWIPSSRLYASMQTSDRCGRWNFPEAQDSLPKDLLWPKSSDAMAEAAAAAGCKEKPRGYIVVQAS